MSRIAQLLSGVVLAMAPTMAMAQSDDVVVMRRVVSTSKVENAPSHQPGSWVVGDPVAAPGCSDHQPTQASVTCMYNGKAVDPSRCTEPRPSGAGTIPQYSQCTIDWVVGTTSTPPTACGASYTPTRTVQCQRYGGDSTPVVMPDSACTAEKPWTTGTTVELTSSCAYTPTYGPWSVCANSSQTQTITTCTRSDGKVVSNSLCSPQTQTQNCVTKLLPNGDAELGNASEWSGATLETAPANVHGGQYGFSSASEALTTFPNLAGGQYTLSFWYRCNAVNNSRFELGFLFGNGTYYASYNGSCTGSWVQGNMTVNNPGGFRVTLVVGQPFYFDDVVLTKN